MYRTDKEHAGKQVAVRRNKTLGQEEEVDGGRRHRRDRWERTEEESMRAVRRSRRKKTDAGGRRRSPEVFAGNRHRESRSEVAAAKGKSGRVEEGRARVCELLHFLFYSLIMSSRRSSGNPRITDDQIIELISKLQQLVPELRNRRSNKASASKVLQETCNYVRSLHKEVDDLSDRLAQLLSTIDDNSPQASIIRSLIN
ncbi:hypothetical protein LXL04_013357 [Taraxacum kok-saghyz]